MDTLTKQTYLLPAKLRRQLKREQDKFYNDLERKHKEQRKEARKRLDPRQVSSLTEEEQEDIE